MTMQKQQKTQKYKEKMSKFEWRLKRQEIHKIKKFFGSLTSILSIATNIHKLIKNKKQLDRKLKNCFSLFY